MIHLKTILHPTDFSEDSRQALELACALARDQTARLILLHVVPRAPTVISDVPAFKQEHALADVEAYREEAARQLEVYRDEASWAKVEHRLQEGNVSEVILRVAEETPCDLIVMGTHGRSRMHQLMMGSVAAEVTRKAGCPVLAVKIPMNEARPKARAGREKVAPVAK